MQYPQRHFVERTQISACAAAAQCHCRSNFRRIGCGEIDSAVAAKAHPQHIYAVGVDGITLFEPFHYAPYFGGFPRSAALRGQHNGVDVHAHFEGVDRTVATHLCKVVAAQTTAVKEYHQRFFNRVGVAIGSVKPEVIRAFYPVLKRIQMLRPERKCRSKKKSRNQQYLFCHIEKFLCRYQSYFELELLTYGFCLKVIL